MPYDFELSTHGLSCSCECARAVGEAADLDNLVVVDGKDLKDEFAGRLPRSLGLSGDSDADHDRISIHLHALDARPCSFGQEMSVPIEHFAAVGAHSGPVDLGMQERPQQLDVGVAASSFEMPSDVGHHAGADRSGHLRGGAEPLNSDRLHGLAEAQQQPTGEVGEAGRAAHEGGRVRQHEGSKIML
jgi:hypothetical protein